MQFLRAIFTFPLLFASAFAQSIVVMYPLPDAEVSAGSDVTVQVQYQLYGQNVDWISVAVGLLPCPSTGCPTLGQDTGLGSVLAQAAYNPESGLRGNSYQNISVTIPSSTPGGIALIGAAGYFASGPSYVPGIAQYNATVVVV